MNPLNRGFGFGFVAGLAVGIALPVVVPAFAEASRPVARALLKNALIGFARLKASVARAAESIEDFMAEVRCEVERELDERAASSPAPAASVESARDTTTFTGSDAKVYS